MREPTGKTRLVGLLGYLLGHTLSPTMHNHAFELMGLDFCYLPLEVKPGDLPAAIEGMKVLNFVGANVTIPHKETAYRLMDECSDLARRLEAVNLIHIVGGKTTGGNTDVEGFICAWQEEARVSLAGRRAILLGAGGAARAVFYALASSGVTRIDVFNRSPDRANEMVRVLRRYFPTVKAGIYSLADSQALQRSLAPDSVLINCTPLGMSPKVSEVPVLLPEYLPAGVVVYDLVYNPSRTRLLEEAASRGARAISGLSMLVHQAALSFRIWTEMNAPLAAMRKVAQLALKEG